MGTESSVPIEPDTQTALLDASLQVNGVLIAGVPGAGGYDAIPDRKYSTCFKSSDRIY